MEHTDNNKPLTEYSQNALKALVAEYGQPAYRAGQIIQWLYQRGATSYDQMTDLPKAFRESLSKDHPLAIPQIVDKRVSRDGTRKYLLKLQDDALVETVGIPSSDNRLTVCFSTQVGCPMGCVFCATGYEGFTRNLSIGEIIFQIILVQNDFKKRVTNIVGMGQGEPFLNYDAVISSLEIINSKKGLTIGARRITVSTCGIISGINRFSTVPQQYTLAISLHAARQDVRDLIMPNAAHHSLKDLRTALEHYLELTNRRITFEYTLIKGVNDSHDDLDALLAFTDDLLCHINLIRLNSVDDSPYQPSSMAVMEHWKNTAEAHGIETTVRISKGSDIFGACGQLKNMRG